MGNVYRARRRGPAPTGVLEVGAIDLGAISAGGLTTWGHKHLGPTRDGA